MSHTLISRSGADSQLRRRKRLIGEAMSIAIVIGDVLCIVALSVVTGVVYHQLVYGAPGDVPSFLRIGGVIATVVVISNLFRGEYQLSHFLSVAPMRGARFSSGTSPSSVCCSSPSSAR